jgi:glycosyltransferase involved in cell wall biosynthesis
MLSINLTVHNKENLLLECLERIKKYTTGTYEIVTVLDGCTDGSELILDNFIKNNRSIRIKKIYAPNVFETKSNNIAARASSGDHIVIIQDDMLINETEWNERMLKPFVNFNDVFSVTARTSHNWIINPNSIHINYESIPHGIWSDILIHTDHANRDNTDRKEFSIRDSSNRGPLVINHSDFESLNYFDESFFPQDMDDHDLHYRMIKKLGKVTGVYWIDYISDNEWGGTRENGVTKQWMLNANHKNSGILVNRHRDIMSSPGRIETRKCI